MNGYNLKIECNYYIIVLYMPKFNMISTTEMNAKRTLAPPKKKKINFRVKPKKKINFRVRPKADPIPTDNRAGLELMAKIPYTRGGGIQAHPAQLLDQINLDLFGMRDIDRTARLEANQPSVGGFGKPDPVAEDPDEDDARVAREELSGVGEGGQHYWNYYREGEVIDRRHDDSTSIASFIHITQNFTQTVKDEDSRERGAHNLTIAYGDENHFELEQNEGRYAELMREFREEHPDEDDYPEDNDWDTEHAYDKGFYTQRKAEDFPELLQKMNKEKQRVFRKNPEFAEYFNRVEAEHGKKIKRAWDEELNEHWSPFTLKKDIRMDLGGWGNQPDPDEDMYFYDEESMDTYFTDWKEFLEELVGNYGEKKGYLRPRPESPLEEID
tara:strand:- start:77 stop:1228 length:1152 start_codon:yes stop_codon:yes gene_type:complete